MFKTKINQLQIFRQGTAFISLSQEDGILLFTVNQIKHDAPGTKATSG